MFEFTVVLICLFVNGVLSCLEMAFVSVSRPQLRSLAAKGNIAAKRILRLKNSPERTLSVLQIGITLVGAVSAAVGGAGAEENLSPLLQNRYSLSEETAEAIAIVIIVLPLTFFGVVLGELVPKSLALRSPLKLALSGGFFLELLERVFSPFVWILEVTTKILLKMFRFSGIHESFEELTSLDLEPLSETNKQYVLNLVNVDRLSVKDIYVDWNEVARVDISEHYFSVMEKIRQSRHTRLPVTQDNSVIGILHTKEFVAESEISKLDWTELIRPIIRVKAKESLIATLKIMQKNRSHLALVEEQNQILGIVTLEDIFEEIVGDILDEDDSPRALLSTKTKLRRS